MKKDLLKAIIRDAIKQEEELPLIDFHKGRVSAFEFVLSLLEE